KHRDDRDAAGDPPSRSRNGAAYDHRRAERGGTDRGPEEEVPRAEVVEAAASPPLPPGVARGASLRVAGGPPRRVLRASRPEWSREDDALQDALHAGHAGRGAHRRRRIRPRFRTAPGSPGAVPGHRGREEPELAPVGAREPPHLRRAAPSRAAARRRGDRPGAGGGGPRRRAREASRPVLVGDEAAPADRAGPPLPPRSPAAR